MRRSLEFALAAVVAAIVGWASEGGRAARLETGLVFERNLGQDGAGAEFLTRVQGARVRLFRTGMEYLVAGGGEAGWEWVGASGERGWEELEAAGDTVDYYLSPDPNKWVRSAPTSRRIARKSLYPGVDWIARFSGGNLEYDLVLNPGADAGMIRLRLRGCEEGPPGSGIELAESGSIRVRCGTGEIVQRSPLSYQIVAGEMRFVESRFVEAGEGEFRLVLGEHDPGSPVVVDPVVRSVLAVARNGEDRVVFSNDELDAGVTRTAAWPSPGGASNTDVFIRMKSDRGVRTIYWGGDGDEELTAVDTGSGYWPTITLAGYTTSGKVPVTEGYDAVLVGESAGGTDGFLLGVRSGLIAFSTLIGGEGEDRLFAVHSAQSDRGTVYYAAGETTSKSWGSASAHLLGRGGREMMVARLDGSGTRIFTLGGSKDERATGVVGLDRTTVVVAGQTDSTDFPLVDSMRWELAGATDAVLARISWEDEPRIGVATIWGGSGEESVTVLKRWGEGQVMVGGSTTSTDLPTAGAAQKESGGGRDVYLARFDTRAMRPVWSTYFGGNGHDEVAAAVEVDDDILIAGSTTSSNLAVGPNAVQAEAAGGTDGYFAHLDGSGHLVWGTRLGGPQDERIHSLSRLNDGQVRVAGATRSREWLRGLAPEETLGDLDQPQAGEAGWSGFAATVEYSAISALKATVGKDLQARMDLTMVTERGADGLVLVESSDPSRLLVSPSVGAVGSDRIWVAASRILRSRTAIYLQALDDRGEVGVWMSGRHLPRRWVPVRLLPSALFVPTTEVFVEPGVKRIEYAVETAPYDPETGERLEAQSVRAGVDAGVSLVSSDESGLVPVQKTWGSPGFIFDVIRRGEYVLTPASPLIGAGAGQSIRVHADTDAGVVGRYPLARGMRMQLTAPPQSRVISEDPAKVGLMRSPTSEVTGEISLDQNSGIHVTALGDAGVGVVRVEGGDGVVRRYEFAVGPLQLAWPVEPISMSRGSWTQVPLGLKYAGQTPAGFKTVPTWLLPSAVQAMKCTSSAQEVVFAYFSSSMSDGTIYLQSYLPGRSKVNCEIAGLAPAAARAMDVEVVANWIRFERPDLLVPKGYQVSYMPIRRLGKNAANQVTFKIADPELVKIRHLGMPSDSITVNLEFGEGQIEFHAIGETGRSTSLTVSAPEMETVVFPVHIVPPVLMPIQAEVRLGVDRWTLGYQVDPLDPSTGRPVRVRYYLQPEVGSWTSAVTVTATPGLCTFAGEAVYAVHPYGVDVNCPNDGQTRVHVQPKSGFARTPDSATVLITKKRGLGAKPVTVNGNAMAVDVVAGQGLQTEFVPPYSVGEVKFTSKDPSKLLISTSRTERGGTSGTSRYPDPVYFQALAAEGQAEVEADVPGHGVATMRVHFFPSTLALVPNELEERGSSVITRGVGQVNAGVVVVPALVVDREAGAVVPMKELAMQGGSEPFLARVTSSNTEVANPMPPTPVWLAGTSGALTTVSLISPGESTLRVAQPPGFVDAAGSVLRIRVRESALGLTRQVVLARDFQVPVGISSSPRSGVVLPVSVTVTSSDPAKVVVSREAGTAGQPSITVDGQRQFYIQALASEGPVEIVLEAPGYTTSRVPVTLLPAELRWPSATGFTYDLGTQFSGQPSLGPIYGGSIPFDWQGIPRPGVRFPLRARSMNESVVEIVGEREFTLETARPFLNINMRAMSPGTADLVVEGGAGSGLSPAVASVTVREGEFGWSLASGGTTGRFISYPVQIWNPSLLPVNALLQVGEGSRALFSRDGVTGWGDSLTVELTPKVWHRVYMQPVGEIGSRSALKLSAPGFKDSRRTIDVAATGFYLAAPPAGRFEFRLDSQAAVAPLIYSLSGETPVSVPLGVGAAAVRCEVTSSDASVFEPVERFIDFQPGESVRQVRLNLKKTGEATLSVRVPAGFNPPSGVHSVSVAVR